MENRIGVIASDLSDAVEQLTKLSSEDIPRADRQIAPRIGFVFSGQGAQYPHMGQSLLRTWPTFTSSMKRAADSTNDDTGRCTSYNGSQARTGRGSGGEWNPSA
ncbi:hypothetical protein FPSE5266_20331 [Fusarium pseudograminearum]|nr:hypothetical protein FPSE5266_20331 [Fusarium pseudograminearum]